MSRARKSHITNEEIAKTRRDGLELPYSPRVDGHKFVIYCSLKKEGDAWPRNLVLKFLATYAARFFVSKLISKDEYTWSKWMDRDDMIVTASGISIRAAGTQLKDIMDYELSEKEAEWTDPQLIGSVNLFKFGRHEAAANDVELRPTTDGDEAAPVSTGKPPKEPKVKKEPKPKIDKTGMVSANDIAKELGVEGREVRGVLRAMKLEKPEHGWAFDKKTAAEIKDKVKAGLREKGKKK